MERVQGGGFTCAPRHVPLKHPGCAQPTPTRRRMIALGVVAAAVGILGVRAATDTNKTGARAAPVPVPVPAPAGAPQARSPAPRLGHAAATPRDFDGPSRTDGARAFATGTRDRTLVLDAGQTSTLMERYTGTSAETGAGTRRAAVAAVVPPMQSRTKADEARERAYEIAQASASTFRPFERPVQPALVGPAVGYGASVAAADGHHPRLRITPNLDVTTRRSESMPARINAGRAATSERPMAPAFVPTAKPPRMYERSDAHITGAPHAQSAPQPFVRPHAQASPTCRSQAEVLPALVAGSPGPRVPGDTPFGTGPAGPAASGGGAAFRPEMQPLRTTDREWRSERTPAGAATPGVLAPPTRPAIELAAQSRDVSGLALALEEHFGALGAAHVAAPTRDIAELARTTGRQLLGAPGVTGVVSHLLAPTHGVTHQQASGSGRAARGTNRATSDQSARIGQPAWLGPSATAQQLEVHARGERLVRASAREAAGAVGSRVAAPHAPVGTLVPLVGASTYSLRTEHATERVAGANRGGGTVDRVRGALAPVHSMPSARPDAASAGWPNIDRPSAMGGPVAITLDATRQSANKLETTNRRLVDDAEAARID